ncbi:recombinase family protein [Hymenobacter sp. CRA2]|uniref:recombinase family protein n=1 Tax=Hymenobacter sp. CRA2 TaxID=1955620 RepID=UPI00098FFD87|nr:recombinase family protein [Hymenobacter sp. CRA2]OON65489.1 resolvase [Hymenobacter sp. CRA2]
MERNYGYARVSAEDQNLATQLDALQRAGVDQIFAEKITGSSTTRPELDKLLQLLRPGDTVTVSRFFRLGRNLAHLIQLLDDFNAQGIRFVALDLGVDSTTPAGKMILTVFSGLAQYIKEETNEKTAHGRALAKANGTHMGRRPGVDPKQLAKVETALKANMSPSQIVQVTGLSESTVKRYRKLLEALPAKHDH